MSLIQGKGMDPDVSRGSSLFDNPASRGLEEALTDVTDGSHLPVAFSSIIVKANAGVLTNFEVLSLLNSRVISPVASSEYKVYDYLMETPACIQTLESVTNFSNKCKDFKLAKAEILNIINLRASSKVEFASTIENIKQRKIDEAGLEKLVNDLLPPLETPHEEH